MLGFPSFHSDLYLHGKRQAESGSTRRVHDKAPTASYVLVERWALDILLFQSDWGIPNLEDACRRQIKAVRVTKNGGFEPVEARDGQGSLLFQDR